MALHKDSSNNIHDDMDGTALSLLPADCVPITDEEADVLRAPPVLTIAEKRAQMQPLSPAQVRLVLNQFGLLTQVESAIASGSHELKIEWEFMAEFKRDNAFLKSMAKSLGLTDEQLDAMFEAGILL